MEQMDREYNSSYQILQLSADSIPDETTKRLIASED
jgi:hypothetical protein